MVSGAPKQRWVTSLHLCFFAIFVTSVIVGTGFQCKPPYCIAIPCLTWPNEVRALVLTFLILHPAWRGFVLRAKYDVCMIQGVLVPSGLDG